MMSSITIILPSLIAFATARLPGYQQFGAGPPSPASINGSETFRRAAMTPNQAYQVYFNYDSQNPSATGANWTWNIAITNVSMANITQEVPDAQVAFIDYRFSWNTGGGIESSLRYNQFGPTGPDNPSSVCVYFVWADFPQNVSDRHDGSSPDCSDALGPECVQAVSDNMKGTGECKTSDFPSIGTLAVRDPCADSFGAVGHLGTLAAVLGISSAPSNVT